MWRRKNSESDEDNGTNNYAGFSGSSMKGRRSGIIGMCVSRTTKQTKWTKSGNTLSEGIC